MSLRSATTASDDERLLAALKQAAGPGWTVATVGEPVTISLAPGEAAPRARGAWSALAGVRVLGCLEAEDGELALSLPLSGRGPGAPLELRVTSGVAAAWDVDRELVGFRAEAPFRGRFRVRVAYRPRLGAVARWAAGRALREGPLQDPGGTTAKLRDVVVARIGGGNAAYVLALAGGAALAGSAVPLVLGTSFAHYLVYVATFERRRGVAFGAFVRDAVFFKALSMGHLAWIVIVGGGPSMATSAGVAMGVGLSAWAAAALGFERTYFGVELGEVPPGRVDRLPYGAVPHPMISGALAALLAVGLEPALWAGWPWLVPGHVALYLLHLAQEVRASRVWAPPT